MWISDPANALAAAQLFVAAVTAAATFALWRVTRVLAKETEALAKLTSQPFVVCNLESSTVDATAFNLTLRNTGNATAFDIVLNVSPPLPQPDGLPSGKAEIARTVSMLPPGNALTLKIAMGHQIHDKIFTADISWARLPKSNSREGLEYTFSAMDGFQAGVITNGVHHVVEELRKLNQHIRKSHVLIQ